MNRRELMKNGVVAAILSLFGLKKKVVAEHNLYAEELPTSLRLSVRQKGRDLVIRGAISAEGNLVWPSKQEWQIIGALMGEGLQSTYSEHPGALARGDKFVMFMSFAQ